MFDFWRFQPITDPKLLYQQSEFNLNLVILSILISSMAAYASLVVLERIWQSQFSKAASLWKLFGSMVFGLGVWAMHFTGMLAFMLPLEMSYNVPLTIASLIPPMVGAYIAFHLLSQKKFSFWEVQLGGLSLAIGIGTMHYAGMEAMEVNAILHYNITLFALSILVAHILAVIAITLLVYRYRSVKNHLVKNILISFVMGCAVAGMHYTAMAAAEFYAVEANYYATSRMTNPIIFGLSISAVVVVIVASTVLCAIVDARLQFAELTVEATEQREKDIVENLADGLVVIDSCGVIDTINSSASEMFAHPGTSLIGTYIKELIPTYDESVLPEENRRASFSDVLVMEGIKSDGTAFPIEFSVSKMSAVLHDMSLYCCVIRDISQRLLMEDQLRQAHKLESIGQLAAGIAHEINTPTQYVSDNTNFLKQAFVTCLEIIDETKRASDSEHTEQQIKSQLEKINQLIENGDMDFLAEEIPLAIEQSMEGLQRISKIVGAMKSFSHSSENAMQQVDIVEAIESTITVARSEWRYVAELETEFESGLPLVTCFRDEFNQVVLNIIVNAAHAIEARYGKGESLSGLIKLCVEKQQNAILVKISDNGSGMPESVKSRIFDPFFTTKSVGKGTGQGLSMAYKVIVDMHKGQILVDSEQDVGTTFTLRIPINLQNVVENTEVKDESHVCG